MKNVKTRTTKVPIIAYYTGPKKEEKRNSLFLP